MSLPSWAKRGINGFVIMIRYLLLVILPLLLLVGCGESDPQIGGEEVETIFQLGGDWIGETAGGQRFEMRLNQRGSAVTGDVSINGQRAGAAGQIVGNELTLEVNLVPPAFLIAEVQNGFLDNGTINTTDGTTTGEFRAQRQ